MLSSFRANRSALERLHLLKKDASPIGQNSRKAVKFLDRMTSGKHDLSVEPIILQGPDEQYATWQEVEAYYSEENHASVDEPKVELQADAQEKKEETDKGSKRSSAVPLSQLLLDKLNFATQPAATSPGSTPPLSPSSSELQSSKTSPEVKVATLSAVDKSPVPPALKPLLNPVVWYIHEKTSGQSNVFFLTNSADIQHLARDFRVPTKTIHQLRSAVGADSVQIEPTHQKQSSTSSLPEATEGEQKTLFSYEDESDEEEVVFRPRGRGTRMTGSGRGGSRGSIRHRTPDTRSPRLSFSSSAQAPSNKPQIPIEEIDPDSFDRGSFGRGSVPLANTAPLGNHTANQFNGFSRGPSHRGVFAPAGPSRGVSHYRGGGRGFDRGSARGRGRLFVP